MRALLSVSDKTGLVDLGRALVRRGVDLVSTGGTAKALAAAGLPVTAVSEVTGFPELLDGRVKTLHPAVHGGILARRGRPDDLEAIRAQGIRPIDLVVVNLYPFARTAASEATFDELIEQIDIGGPSMVRAAAKSFRDVLVVVDPADYDRVLEALDGESGPDRRLRFELARKAFAHTAEYDATIAAALDAVDTSGPDFARAPFALAGTTPDHLAVQASKVRDLRYGENPHQPAALYSDGAWGFGRARILQGKALSFTNLLDLDAAARLVLEFDAPAAAVIKHTNPCGVATAPALRDAYVSAREVDPLSAFGSIVGLNRALDAGTAGAIAETFIECVVRPGSRTTPARFWPARRTSGSWWPTSRGEVTPLGATSVPFWARGSCRSATGSSSAPRRGRPVPRRPRVPCCGSSPGVSRRTRNGRRSGSPGGCARTSSPTPSSSRAPTASPPSGPGR